MLGNFLKYYEGFNTRPVFNSAESMLKWSGLYNLTRRTLEDELVDAGLSPLLINELVTVSSIKHVCARACVFFCIFKYVILICPMLYSHDW